ncbi:hypothetical protein ACKI1I_35110 [Streptomyces turgidiscabies]|uniref:Uncharacterized protein n=1 Tax=Streptomyces turgidiscabies (strain Car8) TaxID=698760 RepID=L7EXU0_STRT8|nr:MULTISPECIES: hypothetical protein [Streptomyces]ELP64228.1 hypothetical protein STRTUCAR8_04616 [Streptomyces turgidiscabies Car8]MDX3495708.1 hypothetical protein [Streptomyces turgidiscabies]GAQ75518.1 hypothetical protein T45_07303 [Streptomyces turgidiscabies]
MPTNHATPRAEFTAPVNGYRLLLPDQWAQVPLRRGTEEAVHRILEDAYTQIPQDAPPDKVGPYRRELARRFRRAVAQAQQTTGLDLYLPVKPVGGSEFNFSLGASILVSESLVPRRSNANGTGDPTDVAVQLLSRDGVEGADLSSGEIDGALAVRREHVASANPDRGVELPSRRVEYIVSVPGDPDRWFVAAFSTIGGGDPRDDLSEALVEWFDAVMANFRWRQ